MREIFDQDRAMSYGVVKRAIGIVGILLGVTALLVIITALGSLFSGHFLAGIGRITGTLAIAGFLFVLLRLAGEILLALHRLNDRLYLVGDTLRVQRAAPAAKAED